MSRHQPTHVGTLTGHLRFDRISSRLAAMFHNNPGHKWCCEWCCGHAKMNKIVIFQLFLAETEGTTSKTYNIDYLVNFSSIRSEEHTSELQSLMRISYAVFCLKKNITKNK